MYIVESIVAWRWPKWNFPRPRRCGNSGRHNGWDEMSPASRLFPTAASRPAPQIQLNCREGNRPMALELDIQDPVPGGIRKIVCKRIDKALAMLTRNHRALGDKAVHDVRKRFKEIRGTLRLVRDELGEKAFRKENRNYRDAARPLSDIRDAKVMVDTLDNLLGHFQGRVKAGEFAPLRRKLLERRREIRKKVLSQDRAVPEIV